MHHLLRLGADVSIQFQSLLMANSKAKLESNGDKATPCFRPF